MRASQSAFEKLQNVMDFFSPQDCQPRITRGKGAQSEMVVVSLAAKWAARAELANGMS